MGIKKLINEKIVLKCYKNKPNSVYATVLKKTKLIQLTGISTVWWTIIPKIEFEEVKLVPQSFLSGGPSTQHASDWTRSNTTLFFLLQS